MIIVNKDKITIKIVNNESNSIYKLASCADRICSFFIDTTIHIFVAIILFLLFSTIFSTIKVTLMNFYIIAVLTNRILFTLYTNGKSVGKLILNIKVIKENGTKLTLWDCIIKEFILFFIPYINIAFILFGNKGQLAHDRMCDTLVISNKPLDKKELN